MKTMILLIVFIGFLATTYFFMLAIAHTKESPIKKTETSLIMSGSIFDDSGNHYNIKSLVPVRLMIEDDGKMWRVYVPGLNDGNGKPIIEACTSNTLGFTISSAEHKLIHYVYSVLVENFPNEAGQYPYKTKNLILELKAIFAITKTNAVRPTEKH